MGISEDTGNQIRATARILGYAPADPKIFNVLYPENGDTCLLLDSRISEGVANPYFGGVFQGAMSESSQEGPTHLVSTLVDSSIDFIAHPEELPAPITAGTATKFIFAGNPNYSLLLMLIERGVPMVTVSGNYSLSGISSIQPDYFSAGQLAMRHLIELGHRSVVLVAEALF